MLGAGGGRAPFSRSLFVSRNLIRVSDRASHRGTPLHPSADQASRNSPTKPSSPSRTCDSSKNSRKHRATDSDERSTQRNSRLDDRPPTVLKILIAERDTPMRLSGDQIYNVDGDLVSRWRATFLSPLYYAFVGARPISRHLVSGRDILDGRRVPVEILPSKYQSLTPSIQDSGSDTRPWRPPAPRRRPYRSDRDPEAEAQPFTAKQIELVKTFADGQSSPRERAPV